MTPQEQAMLNDLIGRVEQTQLTEKDPDAEQLLNQRLARNPDALYILAQTVLVQKYALEQASARLQQVRPPAPQPAHATSFLGNLLGRFDPAPPPPPPTGGQPWTAVPAYGPPPTQFGGGGSSFLRSAATTAAGVAAGAFAFEGVESLLHGFGHSSGFGGLFGGSGAPEEIVTNNYYGDAGRGSAEGSQEHFEHSSLGDSSSDASNLQQAGDDLRDTSTQDDLSLDDASYDDSSSFDDSSSGNNDQV